VLAVVDDVGEVLQRHPPVPRLRQRTGRGPPVRRGQRTRAARAAGAAARRPARGRTAGGGAAGGQAAVAGGVGHGDLGAALGVRAVPQLGDGLPGGEGPAGPARVARRADRYLSARTTPPRTAGVAVRGGARCQPITRTSR
jgi:hypothetical protein